MTKNEKIIDLINKNEWDNAMKLLKDPFQPISSGKNIFHFACLRGNNDIINKCIDMRSKNIYLSDDNGNSGCHLLALNEWDNILLNVVEKEPLFLKLKNDNDEFIYDLVLQRIDTFIKIIECMKMHKMEKYLNYVDYNNKSLFMSIIDIYEDDKNIIKIVKKLDKVKYNFSLTTDAPSLLYAIDRKSVV